MCAEPVGETGGLAIVGHVGDIAGCAILRLHARCAPRLGTTVLAAMLPNDRPRGFSRGAAQPPALCNAPTGLTPREENIFRCLAVGETNRQIAERFGISEKYVKRVVSVILAKLEVRSRTEAAVLAARMGLSED